jgi:trigger factor
LKVTLERLPESRVQLHVEVDQERVDRQMEAAYRRLASRTRIPGFRPGKAPRPLVERHLGRDRIFGEALDKLVDEVYKEALESEDVDVIAQGSLDKVETDPVRLSFVVPVRPTVNLGDYRSIRVESKPVEVTDEAVAEQVLLLRRSHATHVPVDRVARWDDILTADVKASVDDEPFVEDLDAEFPLREGRAMLLPGLAEAFLGLKKGEEKTLDLPIPEDFRAERLRGKTATFTLSVKEVKEEQLAPEDDELAAMVNAEEFETLDSLKERIASDIRESLQREEDARVRSEATDRLVELATVDYPAVMVEDQISRMVSELGADQRQYQAYLQTIGRTEAEFRDTFRPAAEERVRRSLALGQLALAEQIEVAPEEVAAEIEKMAAPMGEEAERFRQIFGTPEGIATVQRNLISERTLERLAQIVTGRAAELPAPPAELAAPAAEAPAVEEAPA